MTMRKEVKKVCPRCCKLGEIEVTELTGDMSRNDPYEDNGTKYKSFQATCPNCGFKMRRRSLDDLIGAWAISKKRHVAHVAHCIRGLSSVLYPGGCAYIGQDALNEWTDDDGSLDGLKHYLKRKTGMDVHIDPASDGVGAIIYAEGNKKYNKVGSFIKDIVEER